MLCRSPQLSVQSRLILRHIQSIRMSSADIKATSGTNKESEVEGHRPQYATKREFDAEQKQQRHQSAGAETGQRPTALQKRFLVITKLYTNVKEIPEYVQHGTMNRMHNRMRIVALLIITTIFLCIFLTAESVTHRRIIRDRAAGKVVTKLDSS